MEPVIAITEEESKRVSELANVIAEMINGEQGIVAITALGAVLNRVVRSLPDTQRIRVVTHLMDQMI